MNRKYGKKLVLHRETVRSLDPSLLGRATGAGYTNPTGRTVCHTDCVTNCALCTDTGPGTDGTACTTCYWCSNDCGTGGACTVAC
jgi:hypothetical protein